MRWIVGSSLRFRFLVVAVAAAHDVLRRGQLRDTPVDVFPEFAPPRVEIQTICLGLSTAEVEELVTVPLEQALNGVPARRHALEVGPAALVDRAIFKRGTDLLEARQLVQERLATVTPDAADLGGAAGHAASRCRRRAGS